MKIEKDPIEMNNCHLVKCCPSKNKNHHSKQEFRNRPGIVMRNGEKVIGESELDVAGSNELKENFMKEMKWMSKLTRGLYSGDFENDKEYIDFCDKIIERDIVEKSEHFVDNMKVISSSKSIVKSVTKPRTNEKIIYDIDEYNKGGRNRKLHQGIPWSSEEAEEASWKSVEHYIKKAGVGRFIKKRSRPYQKSFSFRLCQKRSNFRKLSIEEQNKGFESNYKVG